MTHPPTALISLVLILVLTYLVAYSEAGRYDRHVEKHAFIIDYYKVIETYHNHTIVRAALERRGYQEVTGRYGCKPKFIWSPTYGASNRLDRTQWINHFANVWDYCGKVSMWKMLFLANELSFIPESYGINGYECAQDQAIIDLRNSCTHEGDELLERDCLTNFEFEIATELEQAALCPTQTALFLRKLLSRSSTSAHDDSGIWIMKPNEGTRGWGIKLFSNADKRGLIDAVWDAIDKNSSIVIQKYISNPLLMLPGNMKFDIRLFVLIKSLEPLVVYTFKKPYCRVSTVPYSTDSSTLVDPMIHLTNVAVQREQKEVESEVESVLSLDELFGTGAVTESVWKAKIWPEIIKIVDKSVNAIPNRSVHHRKNSFEILGFDIILDTDFKPWLLEINTNPSLEVHSKVVLEHHSAAIEQAFQLVLDRKRSTDDYERL